MGMGMDIGPRRRGLAAGADEVLRPRALSTFVARPRPGHAGGTGSPVRHWYVMSELL